jgi:hypothetical protein
MHALIENACRKNWRKIMDRYVVVQKAGYSDVVAGKVLTYEEQHPGELLKHSLGGELGVVEVKTSTKSTLRAAARRLLEKYYDNPRKVIVHVTTWPTYQVPVLLVGFDNPPRSTKRSAASIYAEMFGGTK